MPPFVPGLGQEHAAKAAVGEATDTFILSIDAIQYVSGVVQVFCRYHRDYLVTAIRFSKDAARAIPLLWAVWLLLVVPL